MKILKILLIASVVILLIIIFYKYYYCCKKGKDSGKAYECGLFSGEPCFILPEEIRYRMKEGKCLEITDYGKKMSFREVEEIKCREQESIL